MCRTQFLLLSTCWVPQYEAECRQERNSFSEQVPQLGRPNNPTNSGSAERYASVAEAEMQWPSFLTLDVLREAAGRYMIRQEAFNAGEAWTREKSFWSGSKGPWIRGRKGLSNPPPHNIRGLKKGVRRLTIIRRYGNMMRKNLIGCFGQKELYAVSKAEIRRADWFKISSQNFGRGSNLQHLLTDPPL